MAIEARLRELDLKHRDLDDKIEHERRHPSADWSSITELKRQKLKLKEEMEQLRTQLRH